MSVSRHEALQRIFIEACRLGPGERAAFLDEACRNEPDLREEVEAMLAADEDPAVPLDAVVEAGGAQFLAGVLAESGEIPEPAIRLPERVGKYRVLGLISEGGMGIVYEAEQSDPRRRVALKVIRPSMVTRDLLQRFRYEARLLGQLRHAGIAQIYEAGTADSGEGGQPYFAMELVEGKPIDEYAGAQALDTAARLDLVARLCDILHYAHLKSVIHRDLKPSNILVGNDGQPRVLDFGVARATDADLLTVTHHTTMGQLVGTVPYMSPEQASGDPDAIDIRSDVYAVGVVTYELLTGRLPYEVRGKLVHEAVRVIREDEPSSLSEVNRSLRGDIETIVAKALDKDKTRRYQSAAELAADIRRHLSDKPIEARPASSMYKLRKFARRNKTLVGGVVATLVVAVAGAAVAAGYAVVATRRANELERTSYIAGIAAAESAMEQQDLTSAAAHLDRTPAAHRGWEYDHLRARLVPYSEEWDAPPARWRWKGRPVFGPAGRRLFVQLSEGAGGIAAIGTWDVSSGRLVRTMTVEESGDMTLHGPSLRFAADTLDGAVVVGGLDGGERVRITSGRAPEFIRVYGWDTAGQRLLYWADGVHIWDGTRSRVLADAPFGSTPPGFAHFDHSGLRVVLARVGDIRLLDAATGDLLCERRLSESVTDLAFSPDDRTLAVAGVYRNVHLLDARTLDVRARLTGHHEAVVSVTWSTSGSRLFTTSEDGTIRIWDTDSPRSRAVYATGIPGPARATLMPDRAGLVVAGERVRVFPLEDPSVLRGHESYVYRVSFSPDGSMLASSGMDEPEIRVWDVQRARSRWRLGLPFDTLGYLGRAAIVAFSEDGQRVFGASASEAVHWDVHGDAAMPVASDPEPIDRLYDTLGSPRSTLVRLEPMFGVGHDGTRGAIAQYDGLVRLFDGVTLPFTEAHGIEHGTTPAGILEGHIGAVYCAAFSPDGTRIATGGNDMTVRIWDARTCEQLLVLRGHEQYVKDVEFSPDGTILASASGDYTIRLWDTIPLHERRRMGDER